MCKVILFELIPYFFRITKKFRIPSQISCCIVQFPIVPNFHLGHVPKRRILYSNINQDLVKNSATQFNKLLLSSTKMIFALQVYLRPLTFWVEYSKYKNDTNRKRIPLLDILNTKSNLLKTFLYEITKGDLFYFKAVFTKLDVFLANIRTNFAMPRITLQHSMDLRLTLYSHKLPINILQWISYMLKVVTCEAAKYDNHFSEVQWVYSYAICHFDVQEIAGDGRLGMKNFPNVTLYLSNVIPKALSQYLYKPDLRKLGKPILLNSTGIFWRNYPIILYTSKYRLKIPDDLLWIELSGSLAKNCTVFSLTFCCNKDGLALVKHIQSQDLPMFLPLVMFTWDFDLFSLLKNRMMIYAELTTKSSCSCSSCFIAFKSIVVPSEYVTLPENIYWKLIKLNNVTLRKSQTAPNMHLILPIYGVNSIGGHHDSLHSCTKGDRGFCAAFDPEPFLANHTLTTVSWMEANSLCTRQNLTLPSFNSIQELERVLREIEMKQTTTTFLEKCFYDRYKPVGIYIGLYQQVIKLSNVTIRVIPRPLARSPTIC